MADEAVTQAAGLYTSPNELSAVPVGALKSARNTVINYKGVIESRRGFRPVTYKFGSVGSRGNVLMSYRGTVLVQYDTGKLAYDSGSAWVDYAGNYAPPAPSLLRTKFVEADLNFFFTSASGVKMTDVTASEPRDAGLPRGPAPVGRPGDPYHTSATRLTGNPGEGWMPANTMTAYITVVGTKDANKNVKLGEASSPFYLVNPRDNIVVAGDLGGNATSHTVTADNIPTDIRKFFMVGDVIDVELDPPDASMSNGFHTINNNDFGQPTRLQYGDSSALSAFNTSAGTMSLGLRNISVSLSVPPYLTTNEFVRVYRAKVSTGFNILPNADYYLVNEIPVTSTLLTAGSYTFLDDVPDEALRDPFYNNVNVGGEDVDGSPDNENAPPPICNDLTSFDHRVWGANLVERQTLQVALLGVSTTEIFGAAAGLQILDTVTVGGVTFTAIDTGSPFDATHFYLYSPTGHGLNIADAIQATAQSLAITVSKHPTCTVTATYASQANDFPGQLFFEARTPNAAPFTFVSSKTTAWNPDPTGGLTSLGEASTNGLWFSKQDQPEAVPRLNRLTVGERNHNILRVKALGERLFVFTDRGIYAVSGTYPYRVDLISKTAVLLPADSLADFDDALFGLTTQGIVKITNAGTGVLSLPIETDLKRLYGGALATLKAQTAAIGYESYRKYIISIPTTLADTVNTQQYVYDVATGTFTRWDRPAKAFYIVPETDTLYMLRTDDNSVSIERRNQDATDYADEDFQTTVGAISADKKTLTLLSGILQILPGDLIFQGSTAQALVESVNTTDGTVLLHQTSPDWVTGAATVYPGIDTETIWLEVFGGKANYQKHFPGVTFHFRTPGISFGQALFSSEFGPSEDTVDLNLGGWGDPQWGNFAFGQPNGPKNQRVFVTPNATRAAFISVGIRVREARGVWSLLGYTAEEQLMSERNTR